VLGECNEVVCRVQNVSLCGNERIASRSRDVVAFRKGRVVAAVEGNGGGMGGVGVGNRCGGVCIECGEVGGGSRGVCSPM